MADGFYVSSGTVLLTDHVKDVVPRKREGNRIERSRLDGTVVVQVVGIPFTVIPFTVCAEETVANTISDHWATGTLMLLRWLTFYATGYIRAAPEWSEEGYRYYSASLELLVVTRGNQ